MLLGCQSTEPEEKSVIPSLLITQPKIKVEVPKARIDVPELANKTAQLTDKQRLPKSYTLTLSHDKHRKTNNSPLYKKQVCRDNVEVSYSVIDQNASQSTFNTKVQAQAIVLGGSQDNKNVKLCITVWFSIN